MKLAIMQPYLFPYLGYYQLIQSVDTFIIYDDVTYRKKGWINRNYILVQGSKHLFTLNLRGASQNKLIRQIAVGDNRSKLLKTIQMAYAKAPYFHEIYPLLEEAMLYESGDLSTLLIHSLETVCEYLGITTKFRKSSEIEKDEKLKGEDRILSMCKSLQATTYINAIGGMALYDRDRFLENGIELKFIKMRDIQYKQFGEVFIPGLSIIDVMMFNSRSQVQQFLNDYELT